MGVKRFRGTVKSGEFGKFFMKQNLQIDETEEEDF